MAPYITEDFPVTFSKVHKYVRVCWMFFCELVCNSSTQLYYISSAVSLYFPYDFCLYNGMTTMESFSIRYIPFFVSIAIISILVIIRWLVYLWFCYIIYKRVVSGLFINYDNIDSDTGYGFSLCYSTVMWCIRQCLY